MANETAWVESVKKLLEKELTHCPALSSNFGISTQCRLPYALEIMTYAKTGDGVLFDEGHPESQRFATDLLIYEEIQKQIKPRIVIEAKYSKRLTTHEAIVYSHKAAQHKAVTPYLRYGIMLGKMEEDTPLPGRLFRHGVNFDFMISFKKAKLTTAEKDSFVELINSEWRFSEQIEKMFSENRSRDRKRYFMLQNALHLKEIGD
jgi:hypothetical protein